MNTTLIPAHRLSFGNNVRTPGPNHLESVNHLDWDMHVNYRAVVIDRKLTNSGIVLTLVYDGRGTHTVTVAPNCKFRLY